MKKVFSIIMMFILMFFMVMPVYAADTYTLSVDYTGTFTKGVRKDINIILKGGKDSTPYTNAKIKITVDGPANPTILARDSKGTQYNVLYKNFPDAGFQINSETNNVTPIQVSFPKEGTYKMTLSLVDASSGDTVIVTQDITIQVYEEEVILPEENVIDNAISDNTTLNNDINNTIGQLPKTGRGVVEYAMYIIAITLFISIIGIYFNKKRMKA